MLLFALAVYVTISAVYGLWTREGQEFSTPGLMLAILAIPIMWWLARAKIRIADQIGSRALRADAVEAITCGYLSGTVVLGLFVQLLMPGWWWVDSVTSLAVVILLVKEGREALEAVPVMNPDIARPETGHPFPKKESQSMERCVACIRRGSGSGTRTPRQADMSLSPGLKGRRREIAQ